MGKLRWLLSNWAILIVGIAAIFVFALVEYESTPTQTVQSKPPSTTVARSNAPAQNTAPPAGRPASQNAAATPPAQSGAGTPPKPPAMAQHQMPAPQPAAGNTRPPVTPVATAPTAAGATADLAAGRLVFRKCQACHSLEPGKNLVGPSLASIMGRKAGTVPN